MPFQWLASRISEEKDRRSREAAVLSRLGGALDEIHATLSQCVAEYNEGFESDVRISRNSEGINVDAKGETIAVSLDTSVPGFQVTRGESRFAIVVGVLPGKNLFYRDAVIDKYLTMEELTKRILDRALFPLLPD